MKHFISLVCLIVFTHTCWALTPVIEPLPDAFGRFAALYPKNGETLLKDLRTRLSSAKDPKIREQLEILDRYLSNLRDWGVPDTKRSMKNKDAAGLAVSLSQVCTDFTGFRRSLDALLIEASAKKALEVDETLLKRVRQLWDDEYYFTSRFSSEFLPQR